MRLRALALLGGLFLLLPAAALGQSAGDEEYTDPLASPPAQSPSKPPSSSTPPASSSPTQQAVTPSSTSAAASASSQGSTASAGNSSSSVSALPSTGLRVWVLALTGGLMLLSGVLLRLWLRRDVPLARRAPH